MRQVLKKSMYTLDGKQIDILYLGSDGKYTTLLRAPFSDEILDINKAKLERGY